MNSPPPPGGGPGKGGGTPSPNAVSEPGPAAARPEPPLLEIDTLSVRFGTSAGLNPAVDGVSLTVAPGETVGLVGESGSGKTMTALSVLRLVPHPGRVSGRVRFEGRDLLALPEAELRAVRGRRIGMIFQEPLSSLNPVFPCGDQVAEVLRVHGERSAAKARARALDLFERVGIPDPLRRLSSYPHELSGGLRQRVMIAMALALSPSLLIADEPTTALDVTIQAQILALLRRLRDEEGAALLLITHNLGLVSSMADRVAVMYGGRMVETARTAELFAAPRHPYTRGLLDSVPRLEGGGARLTSIPGTVPDPRRWPAGCTFHPRCGLVVERCRAEIPELAGAAERRSACFRAEDVEPVPAPAPPRVAEQDGGEGGRPGQPHRPPTGDRAGSVVLGVTGLSRRFATGRDLIGRPNRWLTAVDGVDLELRAGETLGLVGESGCGKTTLGRMVVRLLAPSAGRIRLGDVDITRLGASALRPFRRRLQMVFQDPAGSLNPRLTVEEHLVEPLEVHGIARGEAARKRAADLLDTVGLSPDHARRYPHEFSGGQRQRVGIARALALQPEILVLDEPVSALDVSVQAQILNLLADLRREFGLTYLFIAHDLAVVRHLSQRVAVMYLGQIVEMADVTTLYGNPLHPYTKALLAAVPRSDPGAPPPQPLAGDPGNAANLPTGCRFHPRCPLAVEACRSDPPALVEVGAGHFLRCPVAAAGDG